MAIKPSFLTHKPFLVSIITVVEAVRETESYALPTNSRDGSSDPQCIKAMWKGCCDRICIKTFIYFIVNRTLILKKNKG